MLIQVWASVIGSSATKICHTQSHTTLFRAALHGDLVHVVVSLKQVLYYGQPQMWLWFIV